MCDHPGSRRVVSTSAWSQSQFPSLNRCDIAHCWSWDPHATVLLVFRLRWLRQTAQCLVSSPKYVYGVPMFPFGDGLSPVGPVSSISDKTDVRNNMVSLFVLRQKYLAKFGLM